MAKDVRQRPKRAEKKGLRRGHRKSGEVRHAPDSPLLRAELAGRWTLYRSIIFSGWREQQMATIVVARQGPNGDLAEAHFLLDFGCLGVKDVFVKFGASRLEFDERMGGEPKMDPIDIDDASKLVHSARTYGASLGFLAPLGLDAALLVLGAADPTRSTLEVELGRDGKPFYFAGPRDNARAIISHLTRLLGPNGFHFVAPLEMLQDSGVHMEIE